MAPASPLWPRVQAVSCIVGIILAGRTVLRPLYRRIADLDNAAIFSATTLLVVLGTSMVTQLAGLSLALGAFLVNSLHATVLMLFTALNRNSQSLSSTSLCQCQSISQNLCVAESVTHVGYTLTD